MVVESQVVSGSTSTSRLALGFAFDCAVRIHVNHLLVEKEVENLGSFGIEVGEGKLLTTAKRA